LAKAKFKIQDLTPGVTKTKFKIQDLTPGVTPGAGTHTTRSIELPIAAMYKYGAGFTYQMRKDLTLGGAAEFLYEGNLPVKDEEFFGVSQVGGKYENVSISIVSVYGKWTF